MEIVDENTKRKNIQLILLWHQYHRKTIRVNLLMKNWNALINKLILPSLLITLM